MPAEHYGVDGTLRQGYYCLNCGEQIGWLYGHMLPYATSQSARIWRCKTNWTLVEAMRRANPTWGAKPHFTKHAVAVAAVDDGMPRFYEHWSFERGPLSAAIDEVYELVSKSDPSVLYFTYNDIDLQHRIRSHAEIRKEFYLKNKDAK